MALSRATGSWGTDNPQKVRAEVFCWEERYLLAVFVTPCFFVVVVVGLFFFYFSLFILLLLSDKEMASCFRSEV